MSNSRQVSVWPLGDPSAGFELEVGHDMQDRILVMTLGHARVGLAKQKASWMSGVLTVGPSVHTVVCIRVPARCRFDMRAPCWLRVGRMDSVRLWRRTGGETLAVEIGEPVTALIMLGEQHVAVGTRRGILVLQIQESTTARSPLDAEFERLRIAAKAEHADNWRWDDRERFQFSVGAPRSHRGPAGEAAALIVAAPAAAFRAISSWLEDTTSLRGDGRTVADVACGLMKAYAGLDFDCVAEVLGDAVVAAGAESSKPWRVLQAILVGSPAAAAAVCERWAAETRSAPRPPLPPRTGSCGCPRTCRQMRALASCFANNGC
jgi:hypothetical protein